MSLSLNSLRCAIADFMSSISAWYLSTNPCHLSTSFIEMLNLAFGNLQPTVGGRQTLRKLGNAVFKSWHAATPDDLFLLCYSLSQCHLKSNA